MLCCEQNGYTALLTACANGHLDVARWLVTDAGSNVRSERAKVSSLNFFLLLCVRTRFVCDGEVFSTVLCGFYDQNGYTALLAACANGHLDVARLLVTDAGSDARSERGNVSCFCHSVCELG